MKIVAIDHIDELPKDEVSALERELLKRFDNQFDEYGLIMRRASSYGLSVYCNEQEATKKVEEILQQTWESADDWFY
ncbi:DinI-like family protein [Enterobacter hormaechei]